MESRKKEIASVTVDEACMKTHPCQHDVTVKYADGTEKHKVKFAHKIVSKYENHLDAKALQHFSMYARKPGANNAEARPAVCPFARKM